MMSQVIRPFIPAARAHVLSAGIMSGAGTGAGLRGQGPWPQGGEAKLRALSTGGRAVGGKR